MLYDARVRAEWSGRRGNKMRRMMTPALGVCLLLATVGAMFAQTQVKTTKGPKKGGHSETSKKKGGN